MRATTWIAIGCLWAALAVALGAFGAHGLAERLAAADQVGNWETASRFQLVHALALVAFGLFRASKPGTDVPGWAFLGGSLLFSGSIYALALDVGARLVWPLTPIGGALLILGWLAFALAALRSTPLRPAA